MPQDAELARIVKGCKDGDGGCFCELVERYASQCYGYFYRLTGSRDTSDELLSELFVKLVERIRSHRGGSFDAWLFRVASNLFHDHLRDKQRRAKLLGVRRQQAQEQAGGGGESDFEHLDEVQTALRGIDEDTREVILLRFYSEMAFSEIARMRGEPIGTTLSKLHRGLKKLRALMGQ